MSGEKDRRSIFGSRISSMFNHEKTVPHGGRVGSSNVKPSTGSSTTSKSLSKSPLVTKSSNASLKSSSSRQSSLQPKPHVRNNFDGSSTSLLSRPTSSDPLVKHTRIERTPPPPLNNPSTTVHKPRRKPPPSEIESSASSGEFLSGPDSIESKQNMSDIIGTLEQEIDQYLKVDTNPSPSKSLTASIAEHSPYLYHGSGDSETQTQDSRLNSPDLTRSLRLSRSPPMMELSEYSTPENYDYTSSLKSGNGSAIVGEELDCSSFTGPVSTASHDSNNTPYPLDDPFQSPHMGNFNSDISYDNFANELGPRSSQRSDGFQQRVSSIISSSSSNLDKIGESRQSSETFESNADVRSSAGSSQILQLNAMNSNGSYVGSMGNNYVGSSGSNGYTNKAIVKPASSSSLSQTPTRNPIKTTNTNMDASSTFSNDLISRTKTSNTMPSVMTGSSMSTLNNRPSHRHSSSISSIRSSNSYRNVNLSVLKKSIKLKPGEGERSNYVLSNRRNAGTAYNDSGPGKWKLPTGIAPMDKSASQSNANAKYNRRLGQIQNNRSKKTSGVELKHGHLQPRLLASEIDDGDVASIRLGAKTMTSSSITRSPFNDNTKSSSSSIAPPTTSLINMSRNNSLNRTTTGTSVLTTDSVVTDSTKSRRLGSTSSSSSGSISDGVVGSGYYQHPGYKNDDLDSKDDDNDEQNTDVEGNSARMAVINTQEDYDDYERPRLVLANPDFSDSE